MYKRLSIIIALTMLSGCFNSSTTPKEPTEAERLKDSVDDAKRSPGIQAIVDKGRADIPGMPGYQLHYMVSVRVGYWPHNIYIVEKNGKPVSGADVAARVMKREDSVSVTVDNSEVSSIIHCKDVEECKKQLAALERESNPDYKKYQELKQKFEPQK